MVAGSIAGRGITDRGVLDALLTVPREIFVETDMVEIAYGDHALPIDQGQTISQPYIVALMAEAVEIGPEDTVLEVGTGSGYGAAVLSRIARKVWSIERSAALAAVARDRLAALGYDNVEVIWGDGVLGWAQAAPFEAIVVTAAARTVPDALAAQLAPGGRLVAPIGAAHDDQHLMRYRKLDDGQLMAEELASVRFVPLLGGTAR
jgi:protein-L-isoaspartate(D-aspartate) O-methyltransferase